MKPSVVGLFTGLALGAAGVFGGFGAFLVVALIGLLGFLVGRVLEGEIDLSPYLSGRGRARR